MEISQSRHILSLSGGKDSAALAIYMRDRVPEMEYIFHDTDKELPETYEYLALLEAILGKRITKTTAEQNFDHWLTVFGGMIPSNHRRWCTKMLKLKPFEKYVGDDTGHQLRRRFALTKTARDTSATSPTSRLCIRFGRTAWSRPTSFGFLRKAGLGFPATRNGGAPAPVVSSAFTSRRSNGFGSRKSTRRCSRRPKPTSTSRTRARANPFYWCGDEPLVELETARADGRDQAEVAEREEKAEEEPQEEEAHQHPG